MNVVQLLSPIEALSANASTHLEVISKALPIAINLLILDYFQGTDICLQKFCSTLLFSCKFALPCVYEVVLIALSIMIHVYALHHLIYAKQNKLK